MMVEILVSYVYKKKHRKLSFGNSSVETSASLPLSINNIRDIEKKIAEECKFKQVAILNYFVLGQEEGADNEKL